MAMEANTTDLDTVHAFSCGNPLCAETISRTRSWHRFCSDDCKQQASIIRRAAALLNVLADAEVLKIVRGG